MDLKPLDNALAASPQLTVDDVAALAEAGYRGIICNRPDGEAADQVNFEEIDKAARAVGIVARYQPIVAGRVQDSDTDDFNRLMRELPKPVVAYCRTGTRSTTLWSLAEAKSRPIAEILDKTRAAGYDMSGSCAASPIAGARRPTGPTSPTRW